MIEIRAFIFSDHFIDDLRQLGLPIKSSTDNKIDDVVYHNLDMPECRIQWITINDERASLLRQQPIHDTDDARTALQPMIQFSPHTKLSLLPNFVSASTSLPQSNSSNSYKLHSVLFDPELTNQSKYSDIKNIGFSLLDFNSDPELSHLAQHFKIRKKYPFWGVILSTPEFSKIKEKANSYKSIRLNGQEVLHIELFPGTWDLFIIDEGATT